MLINLLCLNMGQDGLPPICLLQLHTSHQLLFLTCLVKYVEEKLTLAHLDPLHHRHNRAVVCSRVRLNVIFSLNNKI